MKSLSRLWTILLAFGLPLLLTGCVTSGNADPTPTPVDVFVVVTPTPGTPIPITPTPSTQETTYIVQPNDSLSGIAAKFGITQEQLEKANDIDDPNSIYVGQPLTIPPH